MSNPLTQKVNFYISVSFIASFALFVTVTGARIVHLDLPFFSDGAGAAIGESQGY